MLSEHNDSVIKPQDFQFLADSIPQLVWVTAPDGDHIYYNQRWYAYTGLNYEQSRNQGWSLVLHPEDYHRTLAIWQHALNTGQPYQVEYRFRRYDGTYRWFLGQALPQRDEEGSITKWYGTCTDIEDQKRSQLALQHSRQREEEALVEVRRQKARLERFLMEAPAIIVVHSGPELVFEFINPLYQKVFPERKLLGMPLLEGLPELAGTPVQDMVEHVYRTGETFYGKEVLIPLSPHEGAPPENNYYNFIYQARYDEKEQVDGIMVFAFDVTQQVKARRKLEESQQALQALNQELETLVAGRTRQLLLAQSLLEAERNQLRSLFEQAPVAITILEGEQYVIGLANPAVLQLWDRSEEQVVGYPLFEVMPETRYQGVEALLEGVRTSGKPYVGKELPVELARHGTRETVYFNFVYHPMRDGKGEVANIAVVATEVTDLVRARQSVEENALQLQTLNGELTAANEELQGAHEELRASYEELQSGNEELLQTRLALEKLNAELEARVALRTGQLHLAQQQAEKQRGQIYRLFMQAPAGIALLKGPELIYQMANQTYYQILGRSSQILGKPGREAFPEGVEQGIWDILDQVYVSGEPYVGKEFPALIDMDGTGALKTQYYDFVFQPVREEGESVASVLITALNVTQQVESRKEVEKQARQLRLITDALPVLIGYLDKEEKYRFANQAYQAWFMRNPADLLGKPVRQVVGELAYAGVKGYIDRALAGERLDFEAKMPYREDFVKYIRTSYVPDIRGGEVAGFYTLVSDITEPVLARQQVEQSQRELQALNRELAAINEELRAANEQTRAANEELSQSNRELARINETLDTTNKDLDNFVYTASHDLKAPILNIEGLLRALEKQLSKETLQQARVQQIYRLLYDSVNRFKSTIGDLTEVARISKESAEDVASISVGAVLEEVLQDLEPQILEAGAKLDLRLDCPEVRFSRKNLKSIFYNLLSNAVKYRSPERELRIRIMCQLHGEYCLITVRDNGLGMDMRQEDKIFALFKRLHSHVEGTGIGLFMVKKMLENAGGRIEVESQVGLGSAFNVYIRQ